MSYSMLSEVRSYASKRALHANAPACDCRCQARARLVVVTEAQGWCTLQTPPTPPPRPARRSAPHRTVICVRAAFRPSLQTWARIAAFTKPEHTTLAHARVASGTAYRRCIFFSSFTRGAALPGSLTFTTASSSKKRRLAPFAANTHRSLRDDDDDESQPESPFTSDAAEPALFDHHSLHAHARLSPSSSPSPLLPPPSDHHTSPSPAQSQFTAPQTTSARFIPPHLHYEVLPSKETQGGGSSPSAAFAHVSIDRAGSVDMTVDDNGTEAVGAPSNSVKSDQQAQNTNAVSPIRTLGARSASPAKRTAADMEDAEQKEQKPPGSFTNEDDNTPTSFDTFMVDIKNAAGNGDQEAETKGIHSANETSSTDTAQMSSGPGMPHTEPYTTEEIDEQVQAVRKLEEQGLDEGDRGVAISCKWLARVVSRTSENLKSGDYPKEAREGPVGPLDNSDIVPEGAFEEPYLRDPQGTEFIPLKPGLAFKEQYEVLPYDAWGYIIGAYGGISSMKPIVRYAHDTAPPGASQTNIQWEAYPPTITIRKVTQPESDSDQASKPKNTKALHALQLKKERESRGQRSADDAATLISSSTEGYQKFLRRAKEAAGIPLARKVKVWRLTNLEDVAVNQPGNQQYGVPSPPASRGNSPSKPPALSLVMDEPTFDKMEVGKDMEHVDVSDQTHNKNYNGKVDMDTVGLKGAYTIILEEQIGGPAGGEFHSTSKKPANRNLNTKATASKPGSALSSGRTSPAPGVTTRGRSRKDGRTRGTIGLMNLGNTCYMNSALQCIRSVEELAVFFLSNKYKKEINNDNPLGHHGAMANSYAGVLRGIYESNTGSGYSPNIFKKTLGSIQPMFSGYGQQDSQEFLSFLVDALHEDLNRIMKKPYIENPDSDDSKVHDPAYILELGKIYRDNHMKRNDSVAMDLFSGFYKNTMECPMCDKVSVTFDPYSLLTVQLPMDHAFQHILTFVPLHGKPVMHEIDMDKNSTIKTLKDSIAKKHPGVESNRLWVVEVYSHKIYKTFDDASTLAEVNISHNDFIFMYELEAVPTNAPSTKKQYTTYHTMSKSEDDTPLEGMESSKADVFAVPIFNRAKRVNSNSSNNNMDVVLHPLYITLTREEAQDYEIILKKVLIAVSNITTRPILTEYEEDRIHQSRKVVELTGDEDIEQTQDNAEDSTTTVSDHSSQSEDGYVNVSLDKPMENELDGPSPMQIDRAENDVPTGFMDPQYFISPALRNHLFDMRYAESSGSDMHCASMSGFKDTSVRSMFDRVKKSSRRTSLQSSASGDSNTSTVSGDQANVESDTEADADADDDRPDIRLGDEQPLSAETVEESDDELLGGTTIMQPSQPETNNSWNGRSRRNKKRKGKNHGKGKRTVMSNGNRNHNNFIGSRSEFSFKSKQPEDGPYCVQLGECIILDWNPEAVDALFCGDRNSVEELRGARITDDNGRGGPLFDDPELAARKSKRKERKDNGIDLEDCFNETGKREVLSEDNAWYCNRCKELRQAHKTLEIWTLPDILVVHMKRFGGTRSFRDKIDVYVDYPIEGLDMTDKVGLKEDGKDYIYDLFAVDCHFGGLGGGHYTAMAKNFYDGEWYDYNDSMCSKLGGHKNAKSVAAYLLFYRRRSDKPLGPPALQELVMEYRRPVSDSADEAEDESGEGKLGGPTLSSQHRNGSSSVLAGPGVAVTSSQKGRVAESGGVGAGTPLTQKEMTTNEYDNNDGENVSGHTLWGNEPSWGFIQTEESTNLLSHTDGDNESTRADCDSGLGDSPVEPMDMEGSDYNRNSPECDGEHFRDASSPFQVEHGHYDDIDDGDTHDIVLGDVPGQGNEAHDRLDEEFPGGI